LAAEAPAPENQSSRPSGRVFSSRPEVTAPTYSHLHYDVLTDRRLTLRQPDILLLEGLNVLQPAVSRPDRRSGLTVSDFFDFSIYVDAETDDIKQWYVDRFLRLRETAFRDPESYFSTFAG